VLLTTILDLNRNHVRNHNLVLDRFHEAERILAFSWRTTLSNNILNNSPRLTVPGLYADLAFTLLTYGFALSNLAYAIVQSVGPYERDRAIRKEQRERKDDQINKAFGFLCRASGVFSYIADTLLPEWEVNRAGGLNGFTRPPDLLQEVNSALVKCVVEV
jgi:hypothetical protein